VAVAAMFEGIEVAGRRARTTGAEFGIAMGAAAGVAAHGPGTAAGDFTVGFVGVSGHGAPMNGSLFRVRQVHV
jgi:hypothetical protein